jgi:hypothetical protein
MRKPQQCNSLTGEKQRWVLFSNQKGKRKGRKREGFFFFFLLTSKKRPNFNKGDECCGVVIDEIVLVF